MLIKIKYFGLLAEVTQYEEEYIDFSGNDISEVLQHLYKKYPSKILAIDEKLYSEISIIWKTDEIKRVKPSPLDEARWGLAVIEDRLWDTIPKVHK